MATTVGVVGGGAWAQAVIPLLQKHPAVGEVVLAELLPERRAAVAARFGLRRTVSDLPGLLALPEVSAIVLLSQAHLHGPQALQALRAGRAVLSAAPMAQTMEQMEEIAVLADERGLVYQFAEPAWYRPAVLAARQRFLRGEFGQLVEVTAECLHDLDDGLAAVHQASLGERWRRTAGIPPMYGASRLLALVHGATGQIVSHLWALGYTDRAADRAFHEDSNLWGNDQSNQTALARLRGGAIARLTEYRRVGVRGQPQPLLTMRGTRATLMELADGTVWWTTAEGERTTLAAAVAPRTAPAEPWRGLSAIHSIEQLPDSYAELDHSGDPGLPFVIADFFRALATGERPTLDAWTGCHLCAPGLAAHYSAMNEGQRWEVPDFQRAPANPPN